MLQSILNGLKWLLTKTIPAGRLFGIPLRVHLLIAIFVPYLGFLSFRAFEALGFWSALAYACLYVGILYLSVLAHEFGHAWGNRLVGGETQQIILTPIGGVAMGSGADLSPRAELLVVALGPSVSALLAGVSGIVIWILPEWGQLYSDGRMVLAWVFLFFFITLQINLMLTLFNLLFPLFPMDSARLLRAGFSLKYDPQLVTFRICQIGVSVGIIVLIAGLFRLELPLIGIVGPWLFIIGLLGIQSCLFELERIKHMSVYAQSDSWQGRTVYYDDEIMTRAKTRARTDLGGLLGKGTASGTARPARKSRSPKGPAKVIEISHPPLDQIDDPAELNRMQKEAVEREDYRFAADIKKRLDDIRNQSRA